LKRVDKNPSLAEDILPLQAEDDDTDYQEWELDQVRRTIPALEKLINDESI
jgi:hypothetical protein